MYGGKLMNKTKQSEQWWSFMCKSWTKSEKLEVLCYIFQNTSPTAPASVKKQDMRCNYIRDIL